LRPAAGGPDLNNSSVSIAANGRVVTVGFDQARTADANYQFLVDPTLFDCSQANIITGPLNVDGQVIGPLNYELALLSIENTAWKYNHEGVDLGSAWHLNPAYNDSSWSNGVSVFDAKTPDRNTIPGNNLPVMTKLPLHFATFTTTDLPVYYFRTHFNLPTTPSEVVSLNLHTLADDFDVMYMNNYAAVVHERAGLVTMGFSKPLPVCEGDLYR